MDRNLWTETYSMGHHCDRNLWTDGNIKERVQLRLYHMASGRSYHIEFNPPKIEGKDDETGEPLVQREDDKEDTVEFRLNTYHEQTSPLVEYYGEKGVLGSVDGIGTPDEIYSRIKEALAE